MDGSETAQFRYRAFITYSHRDERWARWVHRSLEAYRVPRRLVGQTYRHGVIPSRLVPIFRDREELSSSDNLGAKINEALDRSENLIIICSPAAAASRWVNLETIEFQRRGRGQRIFCVIVAGEPFASANPGTEASECFPPALRFATPVDGRQIRDLAEPIAADLRPHRDGKQNAKLKLIAGILGIDFDVLKQREQHRHIRRLSAGIVAAGIVAAVTIALAASAMLERKVAERRQKQAENLVDFMLGDLYDKLYKLQRLDLLTTVNDRSMAYFDSLPVADQSGAALALRVRALTKIGNVRLDQGHLTEALAAYQRALDIVAPQAVAAQADLSLQIRHADLLTYVGMTYWHQGELLKAETAFAAAQRVLERPLENPMHGKDAQLLFQLAAVQNNIGHVLESRGRVKEAAEKYRRMESICRTLVSIDPLNAMWAENYGLAHNNLGKMNLLRGDLAGAIAEYRADDIIETRLFEADVSDTSQHEHVSSVRAILGRTLALAGQIQLSILNLRQALDIAQQIASQDSTATYAQEDLAWYGVQLSRLLREQGDIRQAALLSARSANILSTLIKIDPSNTDWQFELAQALVEQAELARTRLDRESVLTKTAEALQILEPLLTKQPGDRSMLLAIVTAKLLKASAMGNAPLLQLKLRLDLLQQLQSVTFDRDDPRLLALEVEALIATGKRAETAVVVRQLNDGGYREPQFVELLTHSGIDYPSNQLFADRLAVIMQDPPPSDAGLPPSHDTQTR